MNQNTEVSLNDYYSQNYADYDLQNSPEKLEFYLNLLRRFIPKGSKIYELGVGRGNFLRAASRDYIVAGCDVNHQGVEATKAKLPGVQLQIGSVECIPESSDLAAVVSFDVLEHLPDLSQSLKEIYGKMRPGGHLIGVVPVYDGPFGWLVRILDKDPTHVTKASRFEWLSALRSAGFQIVEQGGILRKLVGKRYIHFSRPQLALRRTGVAIYFVCRKPQ